MLIEKLLNVTITRRNISLPVGKLSHFMDKRKVHLDATLIVLKFLKSSQPGTGLLFRKRSIVVAYFTVVYAGSMMIENSVGLCAFIKGNLISWSKKQVVVTCLVLSLNIGQCLMSDKGDMD